MTVWLVFIFDEEKAHDEVRGVFTSIQVAQEFANRFPKWMVSLEEWTLNAPIYP
jgi:hypothetical protein